MDLFLLKVKHKYEAKHEEIGIFSSMENVRKTKKEYLEGVTLPPEEYSFICKRMKLDELY